MDARCFGNLVPETGVFQGAEQPMDVGLGYALLTAGIWAAVACGYGAAARRRLAMAPFVAVAASLGALLSGLCTVHWAAWPEWRQAVPVAALVAISGATGHIGMLLNGVAMTAAPAQHAATWTMFQMAMIIPFLTANLSGREHALWYKWLALPFILAALRSLTPDSEDPKDAAMKRQVWLGLLFAAIVCSGVTQALAQEISLRGWRDVLNLRTPVFLGTGGLLLWLVAVSRREYPTRQHWLIGALTGLLVAAGNLTLFTALDTCAIVGRAYMVYPVAIGGSILLFAAYQMVTGKEPCHPRKVFGLACGLVGVALLSLP